MISWINEGRVAAATLVWRDDLSSWQPAAKLEELASRLGPAPGPISHRDEEYDRVGFWARLGAYLIDVILLSAVIGILTYPWREEIADIHTALQSSLANPDLAKMMNAMLKALVLMSVQLMVNLCYFSLMNGKFGATVGKLILGARIIMVDGSPLGYSRAVLRYACETLCWLSLGFGYLLIGIREDKRGLHDLIAKTKVIYKR